MNHGAGGKYWRLETQNIWNMKINITYLNNSILILVICEFWTHIQYKQPICKNKNTKFTKVMKQWK